MSNYTQVTAFTPKDSLVSGNPAKIIKGSEFDSEFSAISAAIASKTDTTDTTAHTTNTSNPHSVTKAQVGLSNPERKKEFLRNNSFEKQEWRPLRGIPVIPKGKNRRWNIFTQGITITRS